MTSVTTGVSTYYNGNTAFCDSACAELIGCIYYTITGTTCQLHTTMQPFVLDSTSRLYISQSAFNLFDSRVYVPFVGVQFTTSLIKSYTIALSSCRVLCNQLTSCVSFSTNSNVMNSCDLAASIANPVMNANKTGYLPMKPSQYYYNQSFVNYIGSSILNMTRNMTYCSTACDALPNCVGYVYETNSTCNLKSMMNLTNYLQDPSVQSIMLSLYDMIAVNNAIQMGSLSILSSTSTTIGIIFLNIP